MITNLNEKVEGKKTNTDFTPIPEGIYTVRVKEIKPWASKKKDIWVNQKDEKNKIIKDEQGKIVKQLVKDCTFYNADVQLEVVNGEHEGRIVFTSLTTHPNAEFITENFLYAVKVNEISLNQVQTKCKGLLLDIDVIINKDNYKIEKNPVSGLEKQIPNPRNEVKEFKRTSFVEETTETVEGL